MITIQSTVMEVSGYNLSWSTFSRHLSQLSRELHSEKYFSDVTLVSDDLVQTEAHRIILSASSPLLKSLLMISPRGQTQLFLKGVKHQQLEAVLKFLYYGEVQVPSAEIKEFLRAGTELEITELGTNMEERDEKRDTSEVETEDNTPGEEVTENAIDIKVEEQEAVESGEIKYRNRESKMSLRKTKRPKKKRNKEEMKKRFAAAIEAYKTGEFTSITACAGAFAVNHSSLGKYIKFGKMYYGGGQVSIVFSKDEELQIVNFLRKRIEIGEGLTFQQLSFLMQALLQKLRDLSPDRFCPPSWSNLFPEPTYVRRFVDRHGIALRRPGTHKTLPVDDINSWFSFT